MVQQSVTRMKQIASDVNVLITDVRCLLSPNLSDYFSPEPSNFLKSQCVL